jgi:hypothetical protein
MAVSLDIGADDLPGQRYNRSRIVMGSDDVQVVHMAHEGFVARATGIGKVGVVPGPTGGLGSSCARTRLCLRAAEDDRQC